VVATNPGLRAAPAEQPASLLRQLGLVSATALVVSNMIGTGVFTTTGYLAQDLGEVKLIFLIWVVGAVCALAGALCYSELGINFPSSGGEYVYLTQAFGPTWGFMTGWVSFFAGFSAPIAAAALAFSDYLAYFWPVLQQSNAQFTIGSIRFGGAQLAASALISVFTVINFFGIRLVAPLQNLLTGAKVAVIIGFILLGLAAGTGDWSHFSQSTERASSTPLAAQFAISMFFIYISYSGWNAATYVAEEVRHPASTLPRSLALGAGLVAILYLALHVIYIYAAPIGEMKGVIAIGSLAASRLFGTAVGGIFAALMALSLISTVNAMVTVGPRLYYAMAKNRAFFHAATRVHPRWHTPVFAIFCQGACSILMTFVPFQDLLIYIGFLLNFFASLSVATLFVFRRRPGWQRLPVLNAGWPVIPAFFLIVGIWMTLFGLTLKPMISFCAVLTIVTGAAAYHFWIRPSAGSHA
jgi:APA family basic amino acid/polyamine antiporter